MSSRVDPNLMNELKRFGDVNVEACFNCGNCTAICPLSGDETPFPRNNIRRFQLGLKDEILQSPDPWLCYYCGDCTASCPRGAEPAEAQMAMRRWLTAQYDWTGLSGLLYKSKALTYGTVLVTMGLVVVLFALFHGPVVTDRVEINAFAPVHAIHILDLVLAAIIGVLLAGQVFRMYTYIMRRGTEPPIPLSVYITQAWLLPYHFVTQMRWSGCTDEATESDGDAESEGRLPWIAHILLVSGYIIMFIMVVGFLPWFQTDEMRPLFHPQRLLGYYAAAVIIVGTGRALWARIRKTVQVDRHSQPSDWLLPGLLMGLAVTGMLISIFKYMNLPIATYASYVAHMAVMVSLYVSIGPLGKWSHMFYRPLALYFQDVKQKAEQRETSPSLAPSGAD